MLNKEVTEERMNKKDVDLERVKREINEKLPENIKVFGIKFVTKSFVAKNSASSRIYEYLLPEHLLRTERNKEENSSQLLLKLNELLKEFEGTHNFHNYTQKGEFANKTNMRYIMSARAEIFSHEISEEKFFMIILHGQSFIYNQIRKMVGMVVSIFQNDLSKDFL